MELDDMKRLWKEFDVQSEKNLKLNIDLLKSVTMTKLKGHLVGFLLTNIIEVFVYLVFMIPVTGFLIDHFLAWKFSLPALVLLVFSGINVYWNIASLEFFGKLKYDTPVTRLQKKLVRLRKYKYWEGRFSLILAPLFFVSLCMVVVKAIMHIDPFRLPGFLWGYALLIAVIGGVIVWLIVRNDHKELDETNDFLERIREFEEG